MPGQEDDILGGDGRDTPFLDSLRDMFDQSGPNQFEQAQQAAAKKKATSHKGPFQNVDQIGQRYSQHILDRLQTPVEQSQAFFYGSKAIRDALSVSAETTRQRLGDTAQAGGFLGSGAVQQGNIDIERGKAMAMSQSINDLFLQLEDSREQDVLTFLSGASGREMQIRQQNIEKRGQNMALASSVIQGGMSMIP